MKTVEVKEARMRWDGEDEKGGREKK